MRARRRGQHGQLRPPADRRAARDAIVGGFHLNGPLFEPTIAATCDALAELSPDYLVPTHCTGWRATHTLAARFPDAYLQTSVGTRFEFSGAE